MGTSERFSAISSMSEKDTFLIGSAIAFTSPFNSFEEFQHAAKKLPASYDDPKSDLEFIEPMAPIGEIIRKKGPLVVFEYQGRVFTPGPPKYIRTRGYSLMRKGKPYATAIVTFGQYSPSIDAVVTTEKRKGNLTRLVNEIRKDHPDAEFSGKVSQEGLSFMIGYMGFKSLKDFWEYSFSNGYTGKIIHSIHDLE